MRVDSTAQSPGVNVSLADVKEGSIARPLPGYITASSGAIAGLIAGVVVCPLDVVKTRLQVQSSFPTLRNRSHGVVATFKQIVADGGPRGLYSGLTPLLVGYLPSWTIYFYVYKKMQHLMKLHSPQKQASSAIPSAVAAGACSTIVTNPIWMIKTRMMVQSRHTSWRYTSMLDAARNIYKTEGILAFYSGLGSALLGLPHVAIHFPLYERLKARWAPQRQWHGILMASIVSKVLASTITYPHEVVRSRNQIRSEGDRYRGILRTVRTLYIEEGLRVFYAGLVANICRAVPASAVTLLTFELVSHSLSELYHSKHMADPMWVGDWLDDAISAASPKDE